MATLYITEFQFLPSLNSAGAIIQAPYAGTGITEQHITIAGTSAPSAAFQASTTFIMVNTDAACSLAFADDGTTPVAVATAHRMGANETRFYGVRGTNGKIAVITNS